jgi:hypothetical protein
VCAMELEFKKCALAGAWILTAGLLGVLGNVTSIAAGVLILGFGLLLPLILILRGSTAARRHRTGG